MSLEIGEKAPDFAVPDQDGKLRRLSDFSGKTLVLYFYPKDNTPGCTTEAQDFRDLRDEFDKENAVIVGVSRDSVQSHQRFREKKGLNFDLLSDGDGQMVEAYGVWQEKKNFGVTKMGIVRTTFVIDPEGTIQKIYPKVRVKGHAQKVLDDLRGA